MPPTALGKKNIYLNNTSRKKAEKLSLHTVTQEETLRSAAALLRAVGCETHRTWITPHILPGKEPEKAVEDG